jgi:hypothetical protein
VETGHLLTGFFSGDSLLTGLRPAAQRESEAQRQRISQREEFEKRESHALAPDMKERRKR